MLRKRILVNTAVNSGGKLLGFALQIFIMTYLIKALGKDSYGMVVLALALVANTNLLEAGFGLSVTKYVAEYRAKGDTEAILRIVNANLVLSTVLGLVLGTILLLINEVFLEMVFTVPTELLGDVKTLIRLLIPLSVLEFWSVGILRVAEGFQRYPLARGIEILKWSMRAAFVLAAVATGRGLPGVGIAYLGAGIVNLVVVYVKVMHNDPGLRLALRLGDRESFGKLFGFSVWIFLSKVFAFLSYRIDTIVIGVFLPPANLAYYSVAFKIYEVLRYGLSLLSSTLVPVVSELQAAMDKRRLSALFEKASRYSLALMSPALIIAYRYMDGIVSRWLGGGFETSAMLGRLFVLSVFALSFFACGAEMMVGINRVRRLVKFNAAATALNLALSLYLVRSMGVSGVVIGTIAGTFLLALTYLPAMADEFGSRGVGFLGGALFKSALCAAPLALCVAFVPGYAGTAAGLAAYGVSCALLLIDKDDRRGILKVLKAA